MKALVIGSDGQDGYYLSSYLKQIGYEVYGVVRKKSAQGNLDYLLTEEHGNTVVYADLNDFSSLFNAIAEVRPDELYNLAGQSEIPMSWKQPILNAEVNAIGVLRLLEAIRMIDRNIRFFQASSSELFGNNDGTPSNETSPMLPKNLYGSAKLFAHNCLVNYREEYGIYAASGILFNHESPRRSFSFVTRKISGAAAKASIGESTVLQLGNLDAVRDWGAAEDYVQAMHLLLQQERPHDVVVATGIPHTVRELVTQAYECAGRPVIWSGNGLDETAHYADTGALAVCVNAALIRYPLLDQVVADPRYLHEELGFCHAIDFCGMIKQMVEHDKTLLQMQKG